MRAKVHKTSVGAYLEIFSAIQSIYGSSTEHYYALKCPLKNRNYNSLNKILHAFLMDSTKKSRINPAVREEAKSNLFVCDLSIRSLEKF